MAESKKLTEADWRLIVSEWESSGESQSIFCKNKGIVYSMFGYWRGKLKELSNKPTSGFKAIRTPTMGMPIKLHLQNGIVITVPTNIDKTSMKNLFDLLGILPC